MARVGRPTTFNSETLEKTKDYIENFADYGNEMPSVAGLAVALKVGRRGIYDWEHNKENKEFSLILEELLAKQEMILMDRGLINEFNSSIAKLALGKHGYSDKSEQEVKAEVTTHVNHSIVD